MAPPRTQLGGGARLSARLPHRVSRLLPDRPLPHGWRDAVLQVALWGLADLLYEGVRGIVVGQQSVALINAESIVDLEKATGTFWEPGLQRLVIHSHGLVVAANWIYGNAQFTVNAAFLAFIYLYRNRIFYFVRNMFFVAMGIALIVHLAVPVAPPRMLPGYGFVDTIQRIGHINQDSGAISLFVNPYAAVPSMHVCFSLLVGITGLRLTRRWWLRAAFVAYPLLVLVVVVVTANHFLFDAVAGAVTAVAAALAAQLIMSRVRPTHWAWVTPRPVAPPASPAARAAADLRI
jgi:membrane-associated phospholipid phosphatase